MLKKKAKGVMACIKCEKCGKKFKVLYESTSGKKVCKECLKKEEEETVDMEVTK
ncbi:MAG: hypothetical protein KAW92_09690 [Candidatus Cloacimonetes bacterium]|nr:hypothetical protein [Candidatus Cloacimonadota bacterium]